MNVMEDLLQRLIALVENGNDPVELLTELVEHIRPRRAHDGEAARQAIQALCFQLGQHPEQRAALRQALWGLMTERRQVSLYVDTGVFPNTGFFTESSRRLSRTILPDVVDLSTLRDVVATLFHKASDQLWVQEVGLDTWTDLLHALRFDELDEGRDGPPPHPLAQVLEALRVLSYRISAIGLEPEVLRLEPALEKFASPFLAQNVEMLAYLDKYEAWWADPSNDKLDEKHLLVLLGQCRDVAERIRSRAARAGTSLSLTFQLQRLKQNLRRTETLVDILSGLHDDKDTASQLPHLLPRIAVLMVALIRAECRKNNLRHYLRQNVELLALRVTENAGHTGEHYITESRPEYFSLLRSALGAGFIVAFMAALKVILSKQHFAPLNEALSFCLNYGLGFVLIHMLHFTVATKQPAMTANAIAASIGEASGKVRDLENLATLIARTIRSQIAAIIGNVGLAIPTAFILALLVRGVAGEHFVGPEKALHMLEEVHPWHSGAIIYAAIAGVCLFLSGLLAGYYDNLCAYNRIPERILRLKWPQTLFGEARMRRVARYVENNLGALAGNFFFGFMLGGVWAIGVLFGLPIDIRHIAFSSANLGFATVALDFGVPLGIWLPAVLGVALIGLTNLLVSFTLALFVALRARGVTFAQGRQLGRSVLRRLWSHPREFFLPPRPALPDPAPAVEPVLAEAAPDAPRDGEQERPRESQA
ncbi:site-specific recombinase [Oryzomicrobium sp.]|uniref:site-specific recombinase n=1 Tax=Oryzomicrobium sp. TaxID=1911578 RepID=UPI002FDF3792